MFSFSSNIVKLSILVSNLARGNDLSATDDGSGRINISDMLDCEGPLALIGVSVEEFGKDLHTVDCIALPDSKVGALVGSVPDSL